MPESFVQQIVEDPMLLKLELGLRQLYYPLGFPLEVQTNSRHVIEAASKNWGQFSQSFDVAPMRLALAVKESAQAEPSTAKTTFMARQHLMAIVMDADNFVMCDFLHAFAFGRIAPALASDHASLRYYVLTPVAALLAEHLALAVVHGALIARDGCGVLLCGDSFAGKSTLAYAAARAGWIYITDDGTYLVRDGSDRYAIGNPHLIRFREDARQFFPELADQLSIIRPNGKTGMEVFTQDLPIETAPGANIEHVVFLDRTHSGAARLRPYPRDQMEAWCEQFVNFGTSEMKCAQTRCYQRLLDASLWELSYQTFDDAVRRLEQLVDFGG
jgi:hypothetical protein